MNVQSAINMIRDHGFHACMTADGLIANMECVDMRWPASEAKDCAGLTAFLDNDICFTETTVFELREDGTVDTSAVRAFLGY